MTTLFYDLNELNKTGGKLLKLDSKVNIDNHLAAINIGDSLTIEYKRIKIVSDKFDWFGNSQLMVVNHIKTVQTKEKTVQSITYFDDDVKPKGPWYQKLKSFAVGPFDPSEYGNPVCYYTPGYQGDVITITTKFWEIDDATKITGITGDIQSCISLGTSSANPYGVYFQIADDLIGVGAKILTAFVKHSELADEHILELRIDEGVPLLEGLYICLPEVTDLNERNIIIQNYHIEDLILVKSENDKLIEYNKTYFVLKLSKAIRKDLIDFDFTASSSDLLQKLNQKDESFVKTLVQTTRDAYDMNLLQEISEAYSQKNYPLVKALYNHIHPAKKEWFDVSFPDILKNI